MGMGSAKSGRWTLEQWLAEYAVTHRNPKNKLIHMFCVPAIMMSVLGLLRSVPSPEFTGLMIRWDFVFYACSLAFYVSIDLKTAGMMAVIAGAMIALNEWIGAHVDLFAFSLVVFVVAWIGQFIGHKIEGKKPAFFQDLVFLLIGPIWVWIGLKQKMGLAKSAI